MHDYKITTPVAFIIFNRPDTTNRVFSEIARARPPKLLVISDGARTDRLGEAENVAATRAIIERVNWDCEVLTNYAESNLGCRDRVSSGIDWVFEQVDEAIILEDDCLPDPSFFRYCQELLERYRHDQRIGMISGDNFQFGRKRTDASYYFSRYTHIWGWASWRRAWQHYNSDAAIWPEFKAGNWMRAVIEDRSERRFWFKAFQAVHDGRIDTWDYQWMLASWAQGYVSITPAINLVSNIGFGPNATHTRGASLYSEIPAESLEFPLRHPEVILPNRLADRFTAEGQFTSSLWRRVFRKIQALLR